MIELWLCIRDNRSLHGGGLVYYKKVRAVAAPAKGDLVDIIDDDEYFEVTEVRHHFKPPMVVANVSCYTEFLQTLQNNGILQEQGFITELKFYELLIDGV